MNIIKVHFGTKLPVVVKSFIVVCLRIASKEQLPWSIRAHVFPSSVDGSAPAHCTDVSFSCVRGARLAVPEAQFQMAHATAV